MIILVLWVYCKGTNFTFNGVWPLLHSCDSYITNGCWENMLVTGGHRANELRNGADKQTLKTCTDHKQLQRTEHCGTTCILENDIGEEDNMYTMSLIRNRRVCGNQVTGKGSKVGGHQLDRCRINEMLCGGERSLRLKGRTKRQNVFMTC